jgi:hypothetical protein
MVTLLRATARLDRCSVSSNAVSMELVVSKTLSDLQGVARASLDPRPLPGLLSATGASATRYLDELPVGASPTFGGLLKHLCREVPCGEEQQILLWVFARAIQWAATAPHGPESDLVIHARVELLLHQLGTHAFDQEVVDGLMAEVRRAMTGSPGI